MKYVLEFKLQTLPKMRNEDKGHWRSRHKHAVRIKRAVYAEVGARIPPSPLFKAKLTLTRHSSVEPDHDGLVSGFKHVIDGLVEAYVLKNDKSENIGTPEYRWVKTPPGKGRITIKVEEI